MLIIIRLEACINENLSKVIEFEQSNIYTAELEQGMRTA